MYIENPKRLLIKSKQPNFTGIIYRKSGGLSQYIQKQTVQHKIYQTSKDALGGVGTAKLIVERVNLL